MPDKQWTLHGRRQPYTKAGVHRVPCTRCGRSSDYQWQVCADGRLYRPICKQCDIELNEMVLRFMGFPEDWIRARMAAYIEKVGR